MSLKEYLFGFSSEDKAAKYLQNNNFEIIERNFHSKFGEIDIIAKKDEILHFVEVKATNGDYETAYRLTKSKLNKIIKTINYYFLKHELDMSYEVDMICIKKNQIEYIPNVSF